jgi:hypothetical protein
MFSIHITFDGVKSFFAFLPGLLKTLDGFTNNTSPDSLIVCMTFIYSYGVFDSLS